MADQRSHPRWRCGLFLCLLLWGCGGDAGEVQQEAELKDYGDFGGNFALTDQKGQRFELAQLRGRVVLLFFGYTYCPDFCPMTLSKLAKVCQLLGERRKEVQVVFVSVDPERDRLDKLAEYLDFFEVGAIGLTGDAARIDSVARNYGVSYSRREEESGTGYSIDHSTYTFLIDRQGKMRYIFRYADEPEAMARTIGLLFE